ASLFGLPKLAECCVRRNLVVEASPCPLSSIGVEGPVPTALIVNPQFIREISGHPRDPAIAPELARDNPVWWYIVSRRKGCYCINGSSQVVNSPRRHLSFSGGHSARIFKAA